MRFLTALLPVGLCAALVMAQPVPQPAPTVQPPAAKVDDEVEVLARGQLHEAFATSNEQPGATEIIDKQPPAPIEELPPDQKPEGENVLWIPGYWDWDDEDKEFTWISGFWRNAPVGRVWVPGDWREVKGGWQWVPGFWNVVAAKQEQPAELEYLPPPPEPIEAGPSIAAPSNDCFYTPGVWVYRVNRYVWRPGYWVVHRPDWVWVPDCYRWTPCGYVFVPGYWDCPLHTRGVLFAPVRFRAAVFHHPRYVYTPTYVVPDTSLHTCLFIRTGRVSYYFGDYFEQRYVGRGYSSWCGTSIRGSNFAVGVAVTRTTYDPLWSYYSVAYRDTPQWQTNVTTVYAGRFKGDVPRPPRTLVQQNTVINNVTNNNTTVVINNKPVAQPVIAPLAEVSKVSSQPIALAAVKTEERIQEQKQAKEIRQIATERKKVETALVNKGLVVNKDEKPRQAKLEVPQTVTARVQERAKVSKPENLPPPPAVAAKKIDPKSDPVPTAKPTVKPAPPIIDPKTGAVQPKKVEGAKPIDPTKPGTKPVDLPAPKRGETTQPPKPPTEPVKPPVPVKPIDPKSGDPKPPTTPPKPPVEQKLPTTPSKPVDPPKPPANPPLNPKPVDPPKSPVTLPTSPKPVDPPKPPVTPPAPKPADPPKPPATPPKVDPPKPPVVLPPAPKPVDPPKPPVNLPRVDPPKPPVTPPAPPPTTPKPVEPPKTPKVDPPKPPATPTAPRPNPPTTPPSKPKENKPKEKQNGKK